MKQIAMVLLFDRHDRLLIYLRDDKPEIPFPNHWDFFGGHLEEGETPEQAMIREVKEELGIHLHCHTEYSLLDGANKVDKLFERIKSLKQPAVAMTDHGNMFGAVEFYREAMSHGVKPIIGCEIYVAPTSRFEKKGVDKGAKE